jgi:hypothetical protein
MKGNECLKVYYTNEVDKYFEKLEQKALSGF